MGKGKKKANKGKKRGGKKTRDDKDDSDFSQVTPEHYERDRGCQRARLAATSRTEDPLKNWARLQNEDCPICMLPLPLSESETNYCVTCGKTLCTGCVASVGIVHMMDSGDANAAVEKAMTCPYCRSDIFANNDYKYALEQEMRRANNGNCEAMCQVGCHYFQHKNGLQQDKAEGLKWYHRAVEEGSGKAAYLLADCYVEGDGVEKDDDKALMYFQKAAELGFIHAFFFVGMILLKRGEVEEGMLSFRKAAMCGNCDVLVTLRDGFRDGCITKDEYAYTLREHQDALNEMKSDARKAWRDR